MRRTALHDRVRHSLVARCGGLGAALVVVAIAAGCSSAPPAPTTTSAPTVSVAPTSTATPTTPPPPALVPEGLAVDNLPYFRQIVAGVWAGPESVSGRAYVDALTAAGFDRTAMQVTEDTTTLGEPAESIQFSVAWRDACLVGQVGPATGDPVVTVLPLLAEGGCLIGRTRSIDW